MNHDELLQQLTTEQIARASFLYYLKHLHGLFPYPHIQAIVELLIGLDRQCAVVIPPGHGKSTIVSQTFPSWYLGNHPDRSILLISSTDKQAKLFLNANRETMEHNEDWARIFPDTAPDPDRGWSGDGLFLKWKRDPETGLALPIWQSRPATIKDPAMSAFGIGGPVIGRRADLIIVDDPYSQEMARSELQREAFHDWFKQTLMSRLKPVPWAKVIVVMTRWHPQDLIAYFDEQNALEAALVTEGKTSWELPPSSTRLLETASPEVSGSPGPFSASFGAGPSLDS